MSSIKWLALVCVAVTRLNLMCMLGKVVQSNARFGLPDSLEVHLDHVRMLAGNGREKTKGRSLDVMNAIKRILLQ